jgi:hypothetical protein
MIGAAVVIERALLDSPVKLFGAVVVALLAIGCGEPSLKPSTGGATDDFGGSMRGCTEEREVLLDENIESLGYSARRILEAFGGKQTLRIVWVPNCSNDSCELRAGDEERDSCEVDQDQLPSFAGTQSEITVTVRPIGAVADAIVPGPSESSATCASGVGVPVEATLDSDDGAVGGTMESGVGTFHPMNPEYVGLAVNVDAASFGGKLGSELPAGSVVEATIEVAPGGSYAHFWVLVPGQGPGGLQLLLEGLMLPDKECMTPFQKIQG